MTGLSTIRYGAATGTLTRSLCLEHFVAEPGHDHRAGRSKLTPRSHSGITHEKVLIFDHTVVTASFNWLSFKGDPKRPLRRESGTLVRKPGFADNQYESYVAVVEGR